jgi:hypothetical protein
MIEYLPLVLTGLGIAASVTYYAMVLGNSNKTRRTQMMMELYAAYRDPEFAKIWGEVMDYEYRDFEDFWGKYGSESNREAWSKWQSVARLFNGIGVLLKKNMIDIELVEELMAVIIIVSWSYMGPILYGFREWTIRRDNVQINRDKIQALSGFEYLSKEIIKRNSQ